MEKIKEETSEEQCVCYPYEMGTWFKLQASIPSQFTDVGTETQLYTKAGSKSPRMA